MIGRIEDIEAAPLHQIAYLNAAKRGGTESAVLELRTAQTSGIGGCAAILIASDLQGMAPSWFEGGASVLLGEALAEQMEMLAGEGTVPPLAETGVVLAGDLYSVPQANKRGGLGDVSSVWWTFASAFRWVVGVAGNHDAFGTPKEQARLEAEPNVHLLDTTITELDGVVFGGVGYISGNPEKRGRRSEDEQLARIELVLADEPDVLVLHEGPNGAATQRGNPLIRSAIEAAQTPLTVCGHCHWPEPLAQLTEDKQILNVDARALLLLA